MATQLPSPPALLRELVATPSASSVDPHFDMPNQGVIDHLANWCEALGFAVEVQQVSEAPAKANLIASLGAGPGGLIFAGHADTVPCDADRWEQDPFVLNERDGRYSGLGATDMKGFFAAALHAAERHRDSTFQEPLILIATADEECTMAGARRLVERGHLPARRAVIGEPTNLRPVTLHKGMMVETFLLRGRSGHSSDPSLGVSALEGMQRVIAALLTFRAELQAQHHDARFAVPVPTLNLGRIRGGDSANRICGSCELTMDLRPVPGQDIDRLRADLVQRVQTALGDEPLELVHTSPFVGVQAFENAVPKRVTPANQTPAEADQTPAPADQTLTAALIETLEVQPQAVAFCTEAPFLSELGIDTVVCGPGDIAVAHQPNEYIERDALYEAVDLLDGLIQRFCVQPESAS